MFPSFCFALATGVGKTRLMGAFVAYLHRAHGLNNFFVLAPGLTIYRKLITDFTPGTPKYVLRGISEFAASPPSVLTAENYERHFAGALSLSPVTIHIFNISKISAEVRGGRPLRIRSFREGLGTSYFDYLSSLPDLVLIMDEAHHYRASAGLRALNELDPLIGLELTATPSVQRGGGSQEFNNIVLEYCIAQAIEGGLVKIPAVITRENFVAAGMAPDELERIKLEDGVRLHEHVKAELKAYAHETGKPLIKPVLLVIAKHTRHASKLIRLIKSADFFEGCYAGKVLQVDSSVNEDEAVQRLLRIESVDEPTEIVIHVNMLKEGWDVANLFTIVPLRAAQARTLIVQSIGRGLRLPYGERTGNPTLDRVAIVAHDRFQEFVDEARKPDFPFRLQQDVLNEEQLRGSLQTITSSPLLHILLGLAEPAFGMPSGFQEDQAFYGANARSIAKVAYGAAHDLGRGPNALPCMAHLQRPDTRHALTETVRKLSNQDLSCSFAEEIVSKAIDLIVRYSIDIPRIDTDAPDRQKLEIHPFVVDFAEMHWPPPSDTLWASYLQSGETEDCRHGPESREQAADRRRPRRCAYHI
jgi:type III restriction enzyme